MKEHTVVIYQNADLQTSVRDIFRCLGWNGLGAKKVLVKPNMLRGALPEECVVTSPHLIEETVSFLMKSGAEVMVGDNPMPDTRFASVRDVADHCGFVTASRGAFRNIGRYTRKVKKPKNLLKEFHVSREVLDCDLLVSLPKYKSHELTTMTMAVKNHFGIIPGGLKPYIHSLFPGIEEFSRVLVEIYETRTPDVVIVDCLDVIDAKGRRHRPGMLIAGDNGHAIDFACALMAGIDPLRVPTIRIARDAGLFDPELINYVGALKRIDGFGLPLVFPFRSAIVAFVARILYRIWLGRIPIIDPRLCTECMSCENVCPPRAITKLHIDYNKCIKCYCCIEVCPAGAIRNKSRLRGRR
ncbi:MAG: DUF362 domain-containing protein [candidate division WOR-3 bacterium]|nr:MAG: DUF362 domain-containing protein [candidate division WOR-3 bacterium]